MRRLRGQEDLESFFSFFETASLCTPGWLGTFSLNLVALKRRDTRLRLQQVSIIKVCATRLDSGV